MYVNGDNEVPRIGCISDVLDKKSKGWLKVESTTLGLGYLPYQTKVKVLGTENHKELVTILEGFFKGQEALCPFVSWDDTGDYWSFIKTNSTRTRAVKMICDSKNRVLMVNGLTKFSITLDNGELKKGRYLIHIPAYPHFKQSLGKYLDENRGGSRFAETWFKIVPVGGVHSGQFLHFGKYSQGCLTVLENWTELYSRLISRRLDDVSVGTLLVK